ncbi:DUF1707 domain-containing protein [Nonomuraea sp. NEAU-A123]|uniref:DUF1707 SHOCT-like domain-containing protein n=1 Tax=Nonomuraea sp. NEAU-A123 TaxID=2839649 RepID=UPI001BE4B921|nr:DUF1707 domain-containing protein [Nonomuraea sp. NEAU-A123]MBT2230326.1 DUF1707 domain-containing protein [Nonomuraea sp. NEAU-A123]
MNERRKIRASDSDREVVAERLSAALTEGRLSMQEYDDRLGRAFQAVTYGELADLLGDLPRAKAKAQPAPRGAAVPAGLVATLPRWLRILWAIWAVKVSINVVVWVMLSVSDASLVYFWPMWIIGPPGAALFGLTAATTLLRRARAPIGAPATPSALDG